MKIIKFETKKLFSIKDEEDLIIVSKYSLINFLEEAKKDVKLIDYNVNLLKLLKV